MRSKPLIFLSFGLGLLVSGASAQTSIIKYSINLNDIAYDAMQGRILGTIPGSVQTLGNRVAWIDPANGAMTGSLLVGSNPSRIVLSTSGKTAFIGLNGAGAFRTLSLADNQLGSQVSLGQDANYGPYLAEDIAPLPGSETSAAVSRYCEGISPRHGGVAMFDGGVQRARTTQNHTGSNVIAFGDSPLVLFGLNIETTEFGLRRISVAEDGLREIQVAKSAGSAFRGGVQVVGDRVFLSNGRAFSTGNLVLQGTFASSGLFTADAQRRRMFFLSGSGATRSLDVFDLDTYVLLEKVAIPDVSGTPTSLIRWGADGLAFRTTGSQLFVIRTSAVPEPATLLALAAGLSVLGARCRRRRA